MGMFDWVNVEMDCPYCGEKLKGFQSKDGDCVLDIVDPDDLSYFKDFCKNCRRTVTFSRQYVRQKPINRAHPYSRAEVEKMGFMLVDNDRLY